MSISAEEQTILEQHRHRAGLIEAVRFTNEYALGAQSVAEQAAHDKMRAVRAALDGGVHVYQLAEMLGVSTSRVYRLANGNRKAGV